jgi:hypothetical protein
MLKAHTLRIYLTIFTLALTVSTAFAQEGEATETGNPTMLILFIGLGAILTLFLINWGRSASDNSNED